MKVSGTFRPPSIGMRVDPYPISGRGSVEIQNGELHVEGGRGIPWQVQVGGILGLLIGAVIVWQLSRVNLTLTLVGFMACIMAGSALGYRVAGSRLRARHRASFALASIVAVDETNVEVQITISFRKRWQTRKQCLHFRPDDTAMIDKVCAAVETLRSRKAA